MNLDGCHHRYEENDFTDSQMDPRRETDVHTAYQALCSSWREDELYTCQPGENGINVKNESEDCDTVKNTLSKSGLQFVDLLKMSTESEKIENTLKDEEDVYVLSSAEDDDYDDDVNDKDYNVEKDNNAQNSSDSDVHQEMSTGQDSSVLSSSCNGLSTSKRHSNKTSLKSDESGIPNGLCINESKANDRGKGIWTTCPFNKGFVFGPYGKEIISDDKGHIIWSHLIQSPATEEDHNIVLVHYKHQVFFRFSKDVASECELRLLVRDAPLHYCLHNHDESGKQNKFDCLSMSSDKGSSVSEQDGMQLCFVCGEGFESHSELLCHITIHKGEVKNFSRTLNYNKTVCTKWLSRKKKYSCSQCGKSFKDKSYLLVHERKHDSNTPFKCQTCDKILTSQSDLTYHIRTHTGERPFPCPFCDKRFPVGHQVKRHIRIHTGEKPYKCPICDRQFAQTSSLKSHIRIHTGETPYRCPTCNRGFKNSTDLTTHVRSHTGEKPYICDICGKGFAKGHDRNRHVKLHSEERPFKCEICGRGYIEAGLLKRHMVIHTGDTPHKCAACGKNFSKASYLERHLVTHTGLKPHKCPVCGKGFGRPSDIGRHMRVHTKVKPYACNICPRQFSTSGNLTSHIQTHSGLKPHACDVCGRKFRRANDRNRHVLTHNGETIDDRKQY